MSVASQHVESAEDGDLHPEHQPATHGHPSDATYWKVALFLGALTGLEVSTYWWPQSARRVADVLLIVMMLIKFGTVAAYFMHLKFDAKILRRVFVFGLVLASSVYIATLCTFLFWQHSGTPLYNNPPRSKPLPPPPTEPPPTIPG